MLFINLYLYKSKYIRNNVAMNTNNLSIIYATKTNVQKFYKWMQSSGIIKALVKTETRFLHQFWYSPTASILKDHSFCRRGNHVKTLELAVLLSWGRCIWLERWKRPRKTMSNDKSKLIDRQPLLIGPGGNAKPRYGGCASVDIPKTVDEEYYRSVLLSS